MKASSAARKILSKFPQDVVDYFNEIDELCNYYGVTFYVGAGKSVNASGRCSGYFDYHKKVLAISLKHSLASIISVAVHEVSHMKNQWANPKSKWHTQKLYKGHNRFFSFLGGAKIYKKNAAISQAVLLELEAERMAVREIKRRWTKYIDLNDYQRQSSAYLYSYLYMGETGRWPVSSPCVRKISKHAPDSLQKSYKKIPIKLRSAFDKYLR